MHMNMSNLWTDDHGTVWKIATDEDSYENTWWWYQNQWWKPVMDSPPFSDYGVVDYEFEEEIHHVQASEDVSSTTNQSYDYMLQRMYQNIHRMIQKGDVQSMKDELTIFESTFDSKESKQVVAHFAETCLHLTCQHNNIDALEYLLCQYHICNSIELNRCMIIACELGSTEGVQVLIKHISKHNLGQIITNETYSKAMQTVCETNQIHIMDILLSLNRIEASFLEYRLSIQNVSDEEKTITEYLLLYVLENGALLDSVIKYESGNANLLREELLFTSVKYCSLAVYLHIIHYILPTCYDHYALYLACKYDNYMIVQNMLEDSRFDSKTVKKESLEVACKYGHYNTVKTFLDKTGTQYVTQRALKNAVYNEEASIVELLVQLETRKLDLFDIDLYDSLLSGECVDESAYIGHLLSYNAYELFKYVKTNKDVNTDDVRHRLNSLPLCDETVDLFMHVFFDMKNSELINCLIQDASRFVTDEHKWFCMACKYNFISTMKLLCKKYKIELYEHELSKCCRYAYKNKNPEMMILILRNVVHKKCYEKYVLSISETNLEVAVTYIQSLSSQQAFLEKAVRRGSYLVVDEILSNDNHLSIDIRQSFRIACENGDIDLARRLIEYKIYEDEYYEDEYYEDESTKGEK